MKLTLATWCQPGINPLNGGSIMVNLAKHVARHAASPEVIDRGATPDAPTISINIDREHGARFPFYVNDDSTTPPLVSMFTALDEEFYRTCRGTWPS